MARRLIVNADDFGLSEGVTRGILTAHERGIVTSASLMVHAPDAEGAAARARSTPSLSVGIHVDLGEWIYSGGAWREVYRRVDADDGEATQREVRGQLELFRSLTGRDPTHVDSHQHVHRREPAHSATAAVASELGVPLRGYDPRVSFEGGFYGQTGTGEPLHELVAPEALAAVIAALPAGTTELCCHPGEAAGLDSAYREERQIELRTLCDVTVQQAVASNGVELIGFADLTR